MFSLSIMINYFLNGFLYIGVTRHHFVMGEVASLIENLPEYLQVIIYGCPLG